MTTTMAPARQPTTSNATPRRDGRLWETDLLVLRGEDRQDLIERAVTLNAWLEGRSDTDLPGVALALATRLHPEDVGGCRLAVVAGSVADARTRLGRAVEKLSDPACEQIRDTVGIYYFAHPLGLEGQVAFLFPGEGAQYPGMLHDVHRAFPEAAAFVAQCDDDLANTRGDEPPLSQLFLTTDANESLQRLDNTMLSVLVANGMLYHVLARLGLKPHMAAGHSMGEWAALMMADCVPRDEGFMGRFATTMQIVQEQEERLDEEAMLLAVGAGRAVVAEVTASLDEPPVYLGMDNCPHQSVVIGPLAPMQAVQAALQKRGVVCSRLPFRRPYHTPLFEESMGPLRELFATLAFESPRLPVYSCTTAAPFPLEPTAVRDLAVQHWASPVRFTDTIEAMHAAGARLFVEVGPRGNLSAFVEDILRGRRFAALPTNAARRSGLTQLNHVVAQLAAHHVALDLPAYLEPRGLEPADLPWQESSTTVLLDAPPTPTPNEGRGAVMMQYLAVMEQFLDVQEATTAAYLTRPRSTQPPTGARVRPLLGTVTHHVPGLEIAMWRRLDLTEDRFAIDHTVGGRECSRLDPTHYGVPVMPMTFTLEILAEAAGTLTPGLVVTAVRDVKLSRWLAFDAEEPSAIEITARYEGEDPERGVVVVRAEVRERVHPEQADGPTRPVAEGFVELAAAYPTPPPAGGLQTANEHPVELTAHQVYHNLFHGDRFQGVRRTLRGGDDGIEAEIEALPRDDLFASVADPAFHFDPVLLDVVLHPLASWHLFQPDLAGRIMLPVGVGRIEFFAPPATPGTRFVSRAWVSEATVRTFSHAGEVLDETGAVAIRLDGVRCWRFYVPFGETNFNGPKDQYFIGRRWADAAVPGVLVRLDVPPDLRARAMNRVTAQVTLSPDEMAEFRRLSGDDSQRWLFERLAAKDAIRIAWHEQSGERLFTADLECWPDGSGIYRARRREDPSGPCPSAVVARDGDVIAALAFDGSGTPGLTLQRDSNGEYGVAWTPGAQS